MLAETFRRFLLPKPEHVDALFAYARSKPGEITVGRDQAETVETTAVKQVHGVDHQCDIGRVFPDGVSELLLRDNRML